MIIKKMRLVYQWLKIAFPTKEQFGSCGKNTILLYPLRIYNPQSVFIEDNVKLSSGLHILNSPTEKVIIKNIQFLLQIVQSLRIAMYQQ